MDVVFQDILEDKNHSYVNDLKALLHAAQLFGARLYTLPAGENTAEIESAFAYIPYFDTPVNGIWLGFIPTLQRYEAVYQAALTKNIKLLNTPEQYQKAMSFEHFYPFIKDLTPSSVVIDSIAQIESIAEVLGYPVFVKGAVKSYKEAGWDAVVANDAEALFLLLQPILDKPKFRTPNAVVRQLVKLKNLGYAPNGFPISKEYRVFLYRGAILAYGFYWDIEPPPLSRQEEAAIFALATTAAERIGTPFIAIDIGQLETDDWVVIEAGDAQFCGLSHVSPLVLWSKIKRL